MMLFVHDFNATHESVFGMEGLGSGTILTAIPGSGGDGVQNTGISLTNSVLTLNPASTEQPLSYSSTNGTTMLNNAINQYTFSPNVFLRSSGNPGGYPAGNFWQNGATGGLSNIGFVNAPVDLSLKYSSPYQSGGADRATDGLPLGANANAMIVAQGAVSNVNVLLITSTTAQVNFYAPTTTGCPVDISTTAAFTPSTLVRFSNAGGSRAQSVNISGLTTHTPYYARVDCAAMQPVISFTSR
jgi:hypothetical protein